MGGMFYEIFISTGVDSTQFGIFQLKFGVQKAFFKKKNMALNGTPRVSGPKKS